MPEQIPSPYALARSLARLLEMRVMREYGVASRDGMQSRFSQDAGWQIALSRCNTALKIFHAFAISRTTDIITALYHPLKIDSLMKIKRLKNNRSTKTKISRNCNGHIFPFLLFKLFFAIL